MSRSKQSVSYVKPEEPAFLRDIKQRVGYRPLTVHDKRQSLEYDNEPQTADGATIVVLKEGNMNAAEYAEFMRKKAEAEDAIKIEKRDIKFVKPKRENDEMVDEPFPTRCNKALKVDKSHTLPNNRINQRLLSFETPEGDDDDDW